MRLKSSTLHFSEKMILENIHDWTGLETAISLANNGACSIFSRFNTRILLHTTNK